MRTPSRLLVLVLLAACVPHDRPAPSATANDPAAPLRESTLPGGLVTVTILAPDDGREPWPAVITLLGEEARIVRAGMAAVRYRIDWEKLRPLRPGPDPEAPRNTVGQWLLAAPTPKTVGRGYFQLIAGNAQETVPQVLDYLATVPEIDPTRIGIVGTSTNGFVAMQALGADPRLAAAAVIAACGDYHRFLAESPLGMGGAPLDLAPEYDAWLREIEPVSNPDRFVHGALLLVNGAADHAVPVGCARDAGRVLARAFEAAGVPERFRAVVIDEAGHALADEARHWIMTWWQRWLLAPRPVRGHGRAAVPDFGNDDDRNASARTHTLRAHRLLPLADGKEKP